MKLQKTQKTQKEILNSFVLADMNIQVYIQETQGSRVANYFRTSERRDDKGYQVRETIGFVKYTLGESLVDLFKKNFPEELL